MILKKLKNIFDKYYLTQEADVLKHKQFSFSGKKVNIGHFLKKKNKKKFYFY